jgi:hypothetical protein
MKTAGAFVDLVLGLALLGLACFALTGMPTALGRYAQEPEDLWILSILFPILAFVGSVAVLAGVVLLLGRTFVWISHGKVAAAALSGGVLLLLVSVLGFADSGPSSIELRLLLIPALALCWSYFLLKTYVMSQRM